MKSKGESLEDEFLDCDIRDLPFVISEQMPNVFEAKVRYITDSIADMLVEKNKKYGNSALAPKRIFSRADSTEQLKVRIDDKLSRISNQDENEDEDVIMDLLGYLILLKVATDDSK